MGKKRSLQTFMGIPAGKFFRREDEDGSYSPVGNAIPTSDCRHY
jgi:hypothetical protein